MEKYYQYKAGIKGLPRKVHYWNLSDSGDGFNIKLYSVDDHEKIVNVFFKSTMAYRSVDEGNRLKLWSEVNVEEGVFIYTVDDSEFIKYFHSQSKDIHEDEILKHYFIMTTDDCFDVISKDDISIEIE